MTKPGINGVVFSNARLVLKSQATISVSAIDIVVRETNRLCNTLKFSLQNTELSKTLTAKALELMADADGVIINISLSINQCSEGTEEE